MRLTSFLTSLIPRRAEPEPPPLSLQARVATLESEVLGLRELGDRHYTSLRKLQGKVYRGVALGDTKDVEEQVPPQPVEPVGFSPSKQELYQQAARIRGTR